MIASAIETLDVLKLKDHECVIVSHTDTKHPHIHCIVNLVNPQTGKQANPHKDHLKLSDWALQYQKERGQDYCPERVKNNELRQHPKNQNKIIKHKQEKHERAQLINDLYTCSDSGKAFAAALEGEGYTLARGNKGRTVLVDHNGNIFALARQLKGQRAKDIRARLSDIDLRELQPAAELADQRKYFDRNQYAAEQQDRIDKAGIEHDQKKQGSNLEKTGSDNSQLPWLERLKAIQVSGKFDPSEDDHLKRLDALQEWNAMAVRQWHKLETENKAVYRREETIEKIKDLKRQIEKSDTVLGRSFGRLDELKTTLEEQKRTLQNIDQRIRERRGSLESDLEKTRPPGFGDKETKKPAPDQDPKRQKRIEDFKTSQRDYLARNKDDDRELEYEP